MRVLLVTTWDTACGIAEHSRALKGAVEGADPAIRIYPDEAMLDPQYTRQQWGNGWDLIHLNYHAALHSRWTPDVVRSFQADPGVPVLITYHDTGVPNSDQCKALHTVADRFIIHEPATDLPGAIYLRQGVPGPTWSWLQDQTPGELGAYGRPILGTVGFPFPWKNYPLLAEATAAAGWGLLLLAPGATPNDVAAWRERNPAMLALTDFVPAQTVVAYLGGCDATAFMYTCANTGTSGAIRQGIAARKPVIAAAGCRQFRDLHLDTLGRSAIRWVDPTLDGLVTALSRVPIQRVDAGIVALAEQDSWVRAGQTYAQIYRSLVGK